MDSSIFKKASEYLGEKNKHRQWKITVTALAAVVIIATAYILSKPAQTLVNNTYCGVEEHTHTEECYSMELVCEYADLETLPSDTQDPAHQDSASQLQGTTPGTAHQHDENCYVEEKELTCGQEESTGHTHTDACKTTTENRELTCGQEESAGHTHTDACKTVTENRELTCGQEEGTQADGTEHSHSDACYTVSQTEQITCGQEESAGHTHTDACYQTVRKLVCGQEEGQTDVAETDQAAGTDSTDGQTDVSAEGTTESTENIDNGGAVPADTDATGTDLAEGSEDTAGTTPAEDNADGAAHVHTEECYAQVLTCKAEEHTHGDQCYRETFCGIQGHTHGVSCYDEEGNLTCEMEEHKHEANCYKEPHCGFTAHIHGAGCYDEAGELTCGLEEHTHVDECYISNTYYCTQRIHIHTNACYDLEGNLRCGSADYWVHSHSETCYDKNERLICTLPEREEAAEGEEGALHTHTEECYGVRGVLACGQVEVLRHEHDENCRMEPSEAWIDTTSVVAYCGKPAHIHQDACKDSEGNVICTLEEHTHTEECFEETGYGCISQIHIHEADCYDKDGNIQCGLADYVLHTHGPLCYGMDGKLLCTLPEIEAHVHSAECYAQGTVESEAPAEDGESVEGQEAGQARVLICTLPEAEAHEHTGACRDENGSLVCGKLQTAEHEHTEDCIIDAADIEITQSFKGADFIVTATYNKKEADLPEEAVLFAERITAEGNEEYYAQRAAQYQEMQGEEEQNTMQALLRIGFTADGMEVEPQAPVTITVQLLDENGMAEGSPVSVVHFGKAGNERIEGTNAEKNRTTFQMNSFSEIALGWKVPAKTVTVDKAFTYEDDAFTVKFHVEGEATLPTEEEIEEARKALGDATTGDSQAEGTVSDGDAEATVPGNADTDVEGMDEEQTGAAGNAEEVVTSEDLEAVVEPLGEDTEKYEEALGHATEADIEDEILSFQVLSYALTYEGAKLDLTGCKVTVEVTPTDALVEFAENSEANVMAISDEEASKEQTTEDPEVFVVAMNSEGAIFDTLTVSKDASMVYEMTAQGKDNEITTYATSQANPSFTVEFYAKIKVLATTHETAKAITVIDTSGPELPVNGGNMKKKNIYVSSDGKVETVEEEREIYSAGSYNYVQAPGLVYFNKIAKNKNYILSEIRVQRKGSETWENYSCADGKEWHFTNKRATQEENVNEFILITEGATIRLIHECQEKEVTNGADFYDYDVSDGQVYKYNSSGKLEAVDRGTTKSHESGEDWYVYTNRQGINSNSSNQTFGFGNSETTLKTTMGEIEGNRANAINSAYGSPTFGLVTGLVNGKIQYKADVVAPNLFNDGDAKGKTAYSGNLIFRQEGDTYTLTGAEVKENGEVVSSKYDVDVFTRQRDNWNKTYYFAGNDFYPLDTVSTAGVGGHDLLFATANGQKVTKSFSDIEKAKNDYLLMPLSDDGQNHNHYFGMYYTVEFDLVKDYVGPLEYLFYGDDDMWVFLDGPGHSGELICDIGGVHSSVGEYVNLWDYIEKGTEGKYKLTFFYTERGASGSTCWMQFTLPSVSFATTEQDTGKLRIEKKVTGNEQTDEEFGFLINFYNAPKQDGDVITNPSKEQILEGQTEENVLKNDYSYTKYNSLGEEIEKDILIWNNSKFTLRADEYIIVSFLPEGSSYAIEEVGPVTVDPKEPGEDISWTENPDPYTPTITGGIATESKRKIIGTISKDSTVSIEYNNLYAFELPRTGGSGTKTLYALAGVLSILFGAGLVYRKKFRERRA